MTVNEPIQQTTCDHNVSISIACIRTSPDEELPKFVTKGTITFWLHETLESASFPIEWRYDPHNKFEMSRIDIEHDIGTDPSESLQAGQILALQLATLVAHDNKKGGLKIFSNADLYQCSFRMYFACLRTFMTGERSVYDISNEIKACWKNPNRNAADYHSHMKNIVHVGEDYYMDNALGIIHRFLLWARGWRGEDARRIKKELNALIASHEKRTKK